MTIQELGSIGELIGAVATVATLLYLAVQIRHSNATTQAVLHQENIALGRDHAVLLLSDENPELQKVVFRGEADPKSLSDVEMRKFIEYVSWQMTPWVSTFLHFEERLVSRRDWESFDRPYAVLLKSAPGYRFWWDTIRHNYDPKFQAHVNKLLAGIREE